MEQKTLLDKLLVVPASYVFWMIFIWLCAVAGLIYLEVTV